VRLRGGFNLEDVLGATAAACVLGADFDAVRSVVREFKGVEHRLEYVRSIGEVEFYNNSKATSVDATLKSLEAFEHGVHLILGGKDKGAPYAPLRPLLEGRVREVILIGAAADRIADELSGTVELIRAGNLENAVLEAFQNACPGDVVLLAPACSSFDQFQDYEHRGRVFKEVVERLAQDVESGMVEWKWKPEGEVEAGTPRSLTSAATEERPEASPELPAETLAAEVKTFNLAPASGTRDRRKAKPKPAGEGAQELKPPPGLVEAPADSYAAIEKAKDEAAVLGEAAGQPKGDGGEEALGQVAGAAEEKSKRAVTTGSETGNLPLERTLVYEISAEELPPAEFEPVLDYSIEPEPSQLQSPSTPERTDDVPLPYEARADEKGVAANERAGREFADGASKDLSSPSERSPAVTERKKRKSAAPDSKPQPRLPGMD
jgi:hypothetical protein